MKLRWRIIIAVICVFNVCLYLSNKRLWRDTHIKFHSDSLVLPSGDTVPVGQWFSWSSDIKPLDEQYPEYKGITTSRARNEQAKVLKVTVDSETYMGLWSKDDNGVVELFIIEASDIKTAEQE